MSTDFLPKKLGTQKAISKVYLNTINFILILKKIAEKLPHYKFE